MDHSIAIPALVAFFITLILGPGLISLPSVSILTLFLRPFIRRVWCVSASPSSHGSPALWIWSSLYST